MYSSTDAERAAEREWNAMTPEERDDAISASDYADVADAYYAAQMAEAERAQAEAIAAEWDRAEQEQRARYYADAVAAIEGGNGITIRNGSLTTVASMVGGVAQMESFNAAGQSVGATPFANAADLLDACRIIATLSAWQIVGSDDDDADSANWEPVIDYEPRRVGW